MNTHLIDPPYRYCGRAFSPEQIERIRQLIADHPPWNRAKLSRAVCELLQWRRGDGRVKDMSCRVAMLRMDRDGLIRLPPPQKGNGNGHRRPRLTCASDPQAPIRLSASALGPLRWELVDRAHGSSLWNELIQRYHYLGWQPLPGAQMRYLVYRGDQLLAALGFGAAAWALAPRDQWIGWTATQRQRNLSLVVNNARFLILPWVRSPNLASRLLAQANKRLRSDWRVRYGYDPVLLETFVEQGRYRGTCYRAASWIHVGQTQGRGKLDRHTRRLLPIKDVLLRPLCRSFRRQLCAED